MLTAKSIAYGAAAIVVLVFSAWLVYLSPRQRAARALSALLASMGVVWLLDPLADARPDLGPLLARVLPGILSAVGLSALYFLSVYPRPRGWVGRSRYGAVPFVLAGVAILVAGAMWPSLYVEFAVVDGVTTMEGNGPLFLTYNAWTVTTSIMLLLFAMDAVRTPTGPVRRALLLVMAGFLTSGATWALSLVLNDVSGRLSPYAIDAGFARLAYVLEEVAVFLILGSGVLVVAEGWRSRDPVRRREAHAMAALLGTVAVALLVASFAFPPPAADEWTSEAQGVLEAAAGVAIAAFTGYALLKHRLFGIDVKLKWTIRRGTVAAVFVAVFFAASQLAQSFLEDSLGWALGGVTAGLLLFAIAPLQRMADRVASAMMPRVQEDALTPERRAQFYRTAVAMALSDGVITRDEERHLAKLAEEMGLGPVDALRLREDVEREAAPVA